MLGSGVQPVVEKDSTSKAAVADRPEANGLNGRAEHSSTSFPTGDGGKLHNSRAALRAAKRVLKAAVAEHDSCVS